MQTTNKDIVWARSFIMFFLATSPIKQANKQTKTPGTGCTSQLQYRSLHLFFFLEGENPPLFFVP